VTIEEVKEGFGYQEIEERKKREEMSHTDIEFPCKAHIYIEYDESEHEILCYSVLEGMSEKFSQRSISLYDTLQDTIECIACGKKEEKKERKGFLQNEDGREIPGGWLHRHFSEEVMRITTFDTCENHRYSQEVLAKRFQESIVTCLHNEIVCESCWNIIL